MLYREVAAKPFRFEAVFSDESPEFVDNNPPKPGESVTLRIRLHKEQRVNVYLCVNDGSEIPMIWARTNGFFDYYELQLAVYKRLTYNFKIVTEQGETYYFNKAGICAKPEQDYNFSIIPGFEAPGWTKGAVMYQIFVDRFYNGDESNDVANNEYAYQGRAAKRMDWNDPVQDDDICNFYGGDLKGVIEKLPYLQNLGIEAIYLNPIFVSPSSHKYDIQDYDYVDPHFGVIVNDGGNPLYFERFKNKFATKYMKRVTDRENLEASNELFAQLVAEAHKLGVKVILDGVFNHCGAFNKWLDREGFYEANGYQAGAYSDKLSAYANYFKWHTDTWPDNEYYDCWWGHLNHPKLNYEESPALRQYILEVARKWVSPPFNADGWRLDVAADLGYSQEYNHDFWQEFRSVVKAANPEAVIIAEHYGDPAPWLAGDEWDTVMNYDAFMEPVSWFLCGMEKHSQEYRPELIGNAAAFEGAMRKYMARFPRESLLSAMNQLSNHDHSRFLTRTNMTAGRLHTLGRRAASAGIRKHVMYLAVLIQMTWPGAPCVYYGDEAGLAGWTDPDDRRPFPWGAEDLELLDFHRIIINTRKGSPALKSGSLEFLVMDTGILCYARVLGDDKLVVVINNKTEEVCVSIPVWKLNVADGSFIAVIEAGAGGFNRTGEQYPVNNGYMNILLSAETGILLSADM